MRVLETERILLKPVEESHLADLLDIQWDSDVIRHMKFKPLSFEDQKKWLNSLGGKNIAFTVFYKNRNEIEIVGLVTLNNIDHLHQNASWGMKFKSNYQGKGLGFETALILLHFGFYHLNLVKFYGDYIEVNKHTEKNNEKIGFKKEGLLVKHLYQNGEFRNWVVIGILKEDFYKNNRSHLIDLGLL